jgi:predicted permease
MEGLWQDLRYAGRGLRRAPGFASIVAGILAIGVAANVLTFGLVERLLWHPIDVREPARLVSIGERETMPFAYLNVLDLHQQARSFDGIAAYTSALVAWAGSDQTTEITATLTSPNYFDVAGARMALGRTPREAGGAAWDSTERLVVLSHAFWRGRFGGAPDIIGQTITLNSVPFTIVGVAAPGFRGTELGAPADIFLPVSTYPALSEFFAETRILERRDRTTVRAIGRLRADVSPARASAELNAIFARLQAMYPIPAYARERLGVRAISDAAIPTDERGGVVRVLSLLGLIVSVVLVLACINAGGLMLARAEERRHDIGVRLALGVGRRRLLRQFALEALLIAGLAAAGSLLLTLMAGAALASVRLTSFVSITLDTVVNTRVLGAAALLSLATTLLCSLWPAWRAAQVDITTHLKNGGATSGAPRARGRRLLSAVQVALSLMLLVCALSSVKALRALQSIDPGFESGATLAMPINLSLARYTAPAARAYLDLLTTRLAALPGVTGAALADQVPLEGVKLGRGVRVPGRDDLSADDRGVNTNTVSSGYFAVMGIPLVDGRTLADSDGTGVVVNQALVRRFWPGERAIGKRLLLGSFGAPSTPVTVVGVARDSTYYALNEAPTPMIYEPLALSTSLNSMSALVRIDGQRASAVVIPAMRRVMHEIDPRVPVQRIALLRDDLDRYLSPSRAAATLTSAFGMLAWGLALAGIYGLLSYLVTRRRKEIGVRMALGADGRRVIAAVMGEALRMSVAGVALGVPLAFVAWRGLAAVLPGMPPVDAGTLTIAAGCALSLGLVAGYLPARAASRVDPLIVLRAE